MNVMGVVRTWPDAVFRVSREFIQPMREFYVAVPIGAQPRVSVSGVLSSKVTGGLQGRPPTIPLAFELPLTQWAHLAGVEEWRGFKLARVEVPFVIGDGLSAEMLQEITITVSFTGGSGALAARPREVQSLSAIAVNGKWASTWWKLSTSQSRLSNVTESWPAFPLYRLGRRRDRTLPSHGKLAQISRR